LSVSKPIVVVGSINLDLVARAQRIPAVGETLIGSDFQTNPGGKGANQAVAVARLGYPVHMIGRVGTDEFGSQLRAHLESAGVNTSGVLTSEGASGVALIVVSEKGENSIVVAPGANAQLTPQDITSNLALIQNAGIVLAQLEIPLEAIEFLASICAQENVPLMLDPAPARELPKSLIERVAWFTPNESEAAFYVNPGISNAEPSTISEALLSIGCRGVILKRGAEGVYLASSDGTKEAVPAFSVKAIDTTAAGDAFNGGFAVGLMLGKSIHESAIFASAVAAISVTRAGAQASMPTASEVEAFLNRQ
jgi:ribokinase